MKITVQGSTFLFSLIAYSKHGEDWHEIEGATSDEAKAICQKMGVTFVCLRHAHGMSVRPHDLDNDGLHHRRNVFECYYRMV